MIQIVEISKQFGQKKAVDSLSLTIQKGTVFGFIGPNGAGKTTTLHMLTGILAPDHGTIRLNGVDVQQNPVQAKRMYGYVPDSFTMYQRITGCDYLRFLGDIYGVPTQEQEEHFSHYVPLFSMQEAITQPIGSYSRGMKQKLAIIGSLQHKPSIWILDEPMVGLDPQSMFTLKAEMRKQADKGNTVFFSTHVLDVAEKLCDTIGIVSEGKLCAMGSMQALRKGHEEKSLEALFLSIVQKTEESK